MSIELALLEAAVMELPPQDRMTLAERILESLPSEIPEAIEQQWIIEANRRWQLFCDGKMPAIDADEVFARLERRQP